jgi:hypothetical protein
VNLASHGGVVLNAEEPLIGRCDLVWEGGKLRCDG